MEFLKEILGEELYKQVSEKITSFNALDENKEKQIKIGNLGTGEYVAKGKYSELENNFNSKNNELTEANKLIDSLKKSSKNDEDMQSKISNYETTIASLQEELKKTNLENALKVKLLEAKVTDTNYLTFKLKEEGALELDDKGEIKGIDDKIAGLKVKYPNFFEGSSEKKFEEKKLPNNDENTVLNKSEILKKPYNERLKIYNENPENYKAIMNQN